MNRYGAALLRAKANLALKRLSHAIRDSRQALKECNAAGLSPREASLVLGKALVTLGRKRAAIPFFKVAASATDGLAIRRVDRRATWLATGQEAYNTWIELMMETGDPKGAWEASQLGQASIIRDLLAGEAFLWRMVPEDLRRREERLRQAIIRQREENGEEEATDQGDAADRLEEERRALLDRALDALPLARSLRRPSISMAATRRKLGKREALVSFTTLGARTAFWIIMSLAAISVATFVFIWKRRRW